MLNEKTNKPRVIQSVQRALDIIDCFDQLNRELSLNEISQKLNLNKSTVHGIINTLSINGYIDQNNNNGKYLLGKKLMFKGQMVSDSITVRMREIGEYYLKEISEKYKVTSHIFSFKDQKLSFLDMVKPNNAYYIVSSVIGNPMPLHATASGKIVLAHMGEEELENYLKTEPLTKFTEKTLVEKDALKEELIKIYNNGYCMEDEEVEWGVLSMAAPIYDHQKIFIGTISLTGPVGKIKGMTEQMAIDIKNFSKNITKELSGIQ